MNIRCQNLDIYSRFVKDKVKLLVDNEDKLDEYRQLIERIRVMTLNGVDHKDEKTKAAIVAKIKADFMKEQEEEK